MLQSSYTFLPRDKDKIFLGARQYGCERRILCGMLGNIETVLPKDRDSRRPRASIEHARVDYASE